MLFDRVPGLYGSGVIPRQFKQIRAAVKEMVLEMFFDAEFLRNYLGPRSKEMIKAIDLPEMLRKSLSSPDFDSIFIQKLTEISQKPEGMLLMTISSMVIINNMLLLLLLLMY